MAFGLQLLDTAHIHPVYHVSQLKLAVGTHHVDKDLPEDLQGKCLVCIPNKLLDRRTDQKQEDVPQVLIEWKEGSPEAAICEEVATMKDQFPDFNLEDKVVWAEVYNDRIMNVYVRRKFVKK